MPSWRGAGLDVIGWVVEGRGAGAGGGDLPRQRGRSCDGRALGRGTEKSAAKGRELEEARKERKDKERGRARWGT